MNREIVAINKKKRDVGDIEILNVFPCGAHDHCADQTRQCPLRT